MAGIYVHVPFCKVKCHYCDFHFSTKLDGISTMVSAIINEIEMRADELRALSVETIYFGGGTPSLLREEELAAILASVVANYNVVTNAEVTLECNPDDLTKEKLIAFQRKGVNRLSIGIQSFAPDVLKLMNRAHNREEALNSVKLAQEVGFDNITIDLIYGVPSTSLNDWKKDLEMAMTLDVQHISAYGLTIEENTVFGNWHDKGKLELISEDEAARQFEYLIAFLQENGFEQYEISNFARSGYISKHNSAYWLGKAYLGFGPSAHSYKDTTRSWNIANNTLYLNGVNSGKRIAESEELTTKDRFNDYLLTRLRTKWGISEEDLLQISKEYATELQPLISDQIKTGMMQQKGERYLLTAQGKLIADAISAELFR